MNFHRALILLLCSFSNSALKLYHRIWSTFIPFPYLQVFQRGAYYAVDVIPDQLGVISLNTMYFYDSNKGTVKFSPSRIKFKERAFY